MKKTLKRGQSPWDEMNREELLREVQRMFFALQSANDVLKLFQQPNNLYWEKFGRGGRALDQTSQVINTVYETCDREDLYDAFYRYAASLLFETPPEEKWVVCPSCGEMQSGTLPASYVGKTCQETFKTPGCQGIVRWMVWKDLTPYNPE